MEFKQNSAYTGLNLESCNETSITVAEQEYTLPVCLGDMVYPISCTTPQQLTLTDFQAGLNADVEIIVVGTGATQQFLSPELQATLAARGVGLESMRTDAACRAYHMLTCDGRKTWAWLFSCIQAA